MNVNILIPLFILGSILKSQLSGGSEFIFTDVSTHPISYWESEHWTEMCIKQIPCLARAWTYELRSGGHWRWFSSHDRRRCPSLTARGWGWGICKSRGLASWLLPFWSQEVGPCLLNVIHDRRAGRRSLTVLGPLLQTKTSWRSRPWLMETVCAQSELQNPGDKHKRVFYNRPCKGPVVNWEFTPFISANTMHASLTYNNWDSYKETILFLLKSVTLRWPWQRQC